MPAMILDIGYDFIPTDHMNSHRDIAVYIVRRHFSCLKYKSTVVHANTMH